MNIQALGAFVTVAREGSLTRAAEKLHLTQPAIGLQIKTLQAQTGLRLFRRSARGMLLTADGAALLPLAEKVLQAHTAFKTGAARLHNELRGGLKIGTILDPEFTRLGAFLKSLTTRAPHIEISLSHGMSGDVLAQVVGGELDAGFYLSPPPGGPLASASGSARPSPDESLASMRMLTPFTYRVIGPEGWERRMEDGDWLALGRLPWLATPPASVHHRLLAHVYGPGSLTGVSMNGVAMVDQEASMLDLVRSGVGLSLARDHIALRAAQAHGLVVARHARLDCLLNFVCLKTRVNDPLVAAAVAALDTVWPPVRPEAL